MTEHELQNQIRVALSEYGLVFRTNAGSFWQGKRMWSREYGGYVLTALSRVEGLPEGFSDLLFIDDRGCAFIEVKAKNGNCAKAKRNLYHVCNRWDSAQASHIPLKMLSIL